MRREAKGGTGAPSKVLGAARYEFKMQSRRKAVWISLPLLGLLAFTGEAAPWDQPVDAPLVVVVVTWAMVLQLFMPLGIGCLLSNRLTRDGHTGVRDLLETLPAHPFGRLVGKFLGSTLATIVPMFLFYCAGVAYVVADRGDLFAVPLALAAFTAINLPGLLFVGAFSVSVPVLVWGPLYGVLFVGYWFWGNLLPDYAGIPSLTGTWLTPVGEYMISGFFGVEGLYVAQAKAWEGLLSTGLLLGLSALALLCAQLVLQFRQARR